MDLSFLKNEELIRTEVTAGLDDLSAEEILAWALDKFSPRIDIIKVNPLADWSYDQVWDYIRKNDVPYNWLCDQGYASIGCAPCTRAVKRVEDLRAGRWWWENEESKECGLHFNLNGKVDETEGG
jgi:3'-phosphoadenosine 5'-phosphosulfate sulfotransferase (PAPS reductase)/FAD synthetase